MKNSVLFYRSVNGQHRPRTPQLCIHCLFVYADAESTEFWSRRAVMRCWSASEGAGSKACHDLLLSFLVWMFFN